jgi:hypothetical protein
VFFNEIGPALAVTFGGILRLRAPTLGGAGVVFAIEAYLKIYFYLLNDRAVIPNLSGDYKYGFYYLIA